MSSTAPKKPTTDLSSSSSPEPGSSPPAFLSPMTWSGVEEVTEEMLQQCQRRVFKEKAFRTHIASNEVELRSNIESLMADKEDLQERLAKLEKENERLAKVEKENERLENDLLKMTIVHVPGLVRLLREGETLADLQRLSPEQILIRWVNYHLEHAGVDRRLNNVTTDVMDSEIYSHLLKQIAPAERGVTLEPLTISHDNVRRAEAMLKEADKLNCRDFVTANDVSNGVYKLNLAFVANLFNTWPGLKPPGEDEVDIIEWVNKKLKAAGKQSVVSSFQDPKLSDARAIIDLIDAIQPDVIDYGLVRDGGTDADKLANAKYAVTTARKVGAKVYALPEDIVEVKPKVLLTVFACLMARDYQLNVPEQSPACGQPTIAASSPAIPLGGDQSMPSPVRQESPLPPSAEPNGRGRRVSRWYDQTFCCNLM